MKNLVHTWNFDNFAEVINSLLLLAMTLRCRSAGVTPTAAAAGRQCAIGQRGHRWEWDGDATGHGAGPSAGPPDGGGGRLRGGAGGGDGRGGDGGGAWGRAAGAGSSRARGPIEDPALPPPEWPAAGGRADRPGPHPQQWRLGGRSGARA